MRAYIGITGHFIEDYQLQGVMLACRRFEGIHIAENVLTNYEDIITQFNLQGKVGYIVTYNAANMVKAFVKLPGAEVERGDDSESDEDEDQDFYIPVDSLEKFYHIPQHISCFIHTLQLVLVVQDGLKDIGSVSPIISKASKMVSFVRHSCKASSLFENHNKLQAKNDTRWNSTNKMLKSLLNVDPRIIEELDYKSKLTKYEMKIISEITAILTPFELATMKSQAQNSVTSSLIIPCIRGIRAELKELFTTYKSKMLTTLTSSLERRLLKYEEEDIFKLADTLDPRWKLDWCDHLEANYIKDLITKKLCEMILHVQSDTLVSETESIAPPKKRCKLFSFMGDGDASVKQQGDNYSLASIQLRNYLTQPNIPEDHDPLQYWKQTMPELTTLALYLAIPASSAPVERLFSIAGKVFRPDRCRLSDKRFEELMFVRGNKHLQ